MNYLRLSLVSAPVAGMILVIGCASQPAKSILNDPGQRPSPASRNANSWEPPATAFEESFGIGDRPAQSMSVKNNESIQGHRDHKMTPDMEHDTMDMPQDMEHSQMKASDMEAEEPPMNHQQHQHGDY